MLFVRSAVAQPPLVPPPTPEFSAGAESIVVTHPEWASSTGDLAAESPEFATPQGSHETEIEAFEKRLQKLEESNSKLDSSLKKKFVMPGTSRNTMRLSGRIQIDYWTFPQTDAGAAAFEGGNPQDRFLFRRARFGADGKINDFMLYKIEWELSDPSNIGFRDLYLGFEDVPFLQTVLIGNQKRPYSLDQLTSSRDTVFMERPFVADDFDDEIRRLGIVSYGVSQDEAWNWRYGAFLQEPLQNDGIYIGDQYQGQLAGRIANTYWWEDDGRSYAHWAISGTWAEPDGNGAGLDHLNQARFSTRPEARTSRRWLDTGRIDGATSYEILGFEKVLNFGPLQLVGEVQDLWVQRTGEDLHFWGAYCYAAYMITGETHTWDRKMGTPVRVVPFRNFSVFHRGEDGSPPGWGAWQVAIRYSHLDITDSNIAGGVGNSVTLGLNWYWNANGRLQFNYVKGWIDDHAPVAGQTEAEYGILGLRAAVDF